MATAPRRPLGHLALPRAGDTARARQLIGREPVVEHLVPAPFALLLLPAEGVVDFFAVCRRKAIRLRTLSRFAICVQI